MSGLFQRAGKQVARTAEIEREGTAVVAAFDQASASYTLTYRGTNIGPVWSLNALRYPVGATVRVIVAGSLIKSVIP